jgi:Co/Zn/Cd efflux system component
VEWLHAEQGLHVVFRGRAKCGFSTRRSVGLIRESSRILLDYQASPEVLRRVKEALEACPGDRVTDLHVWMVSPGVHAADISLISDDPKPPGVYKAQLPSDCAIAHATVEVHQGEP